MQACTIILRGVPLCSLRQAVCHPGVVHLPSKVAQISRSGRKAYMASKAAGPSDLASVPGVHEPDAATKDFIFQQTMYRIKEPKRSLEFYTKVMGFRLLEKLDFEEAKFSLYFLGHQPADAIPEDRGDRIEWMFTRKACLELTHNWGSENDPKFKAHNGNDEPQGYGHIGFHVNNVDEACNRFDDLGVEFVKRPDAGKMKGLAFIKDPDGYWIEIFNGKTSRQFA